MKMQQRADAALRTVLRVSEVGGVVLVLFSVFAGVASVLEKLVGVKFIGLPPAYVIAMFFLAGFGVLMESTLVLEWIRCVPLLRRLAIRLRMLRAAEF